VTSTTGRWRCPTCGEANSSVFDYCRACGIERPPDVEIAPPSDVWVAPDGPIAVRVYRAHQQADAVADFQSDAALLAEKGYHPVSQSWAEGQWGCGAWLVALILCVVVIGILVFIYMLIVKPDGTLTVTYELADAAPPRPPEPPASASVRERLGQLDDLRTAGVLITTSTFSNEARAYVSGIEKRIVLIDGRELARLMFEFDVAVTQTGPPYILKRVDLDFFE